MSRMRINHLELTLPPGTLEREKANLNAFYQDVFGWEGIEVPMVKLDCPKYLLRFDAESSQFLFLTEEANALKSTSFDHIGLILKPRRCGCRLCCTAHSAGSSRMHGWKSWRCRIRGRRHAEQSLVLRALYPAIVD
ncbi:MAG: hypothetical protein R3F47_13025 [Gammaproteobacteria bacterium]